MIKDVVAGYFPGRNEIAVDASIRIREMFGKIHIQQALKQIFDQLGPVKAMFGAAEQVPQIAGLFDSLQSLIEFDFSFSAGIKVLNTFSIFTPGTNDVSTSLFFRIDNLGVVAEARTNEAAFSIFPGVNVESGSFLLSTGVRIAFPFEAEITRSGSLRSGMEFSSTLKTIAFEPNGQLLATLPFDATINGFAQTLTIKFQDENLFDTRELLVKVDFPVCPVLSVVDGLLSKLGSLGFSPQSIIGPVGLSGIEFGGILDEFFPNVGQFIDGILEG
jgi:hypothetical protein